MRTPLPSVSPDWFESPHRQRKSGFVDTYLTNKEIGAELGISASRVDAEIRTALHKLQAHPFAKAYFEESNL